MTFPDVFFSHYDDVKRPVDWRGHFGNDHPLDVEIGFGLGEFLVSQAHNSPERNFVGLEQDWPRLKKAMQKIDALRQGSPDGTLGNIQLLKVDATVALERLFCQRSIHRIFCLFPCPWPKQGHVKHRLFSRSFFELLNSRLVEQGEGRIVTDSGLFFEWIHAEADGTGFAATTRTIKPQFNTKFERKWRREGQEEFFELQIVKKEHRDIPVAEDADMKAYFLRDFNPDRFQPDDVIGDVSVVFKDFVFDPKKNKGLVHAVVAEPSLTQHVWIIIVKTSKDWCVAKAEGHTALPTQGVATALRHVYEAARRTG